MKHNSMQMSQRDRQVAELLLQGCDNLQIAKQLNVARRTVKAHFWRLFALFGVTTGVKRVKLAVILYRRQLRLQTTVTEQEHSGVPNTESSKFSPRASRTKELPTMQSQQPNTLLKSASSVKDSNPATVSRLNPGTTCNAGCLALESDKVESWEEKVLQIGQFRTGNPV